MAAAHADLITVSLDPTSSPAPTRRSRARSRWSPAAAAGHEPLHGGFVGAGMLDAAVPGRGVHLADPGPDAGGHPGRQRRRRRAAHREELHRRRAELRDRRRAGRAPRTSRSRTVVVDDDVAVKDSTWTGRPARRRRHRAGGEDRRCGRRAAATTWPRSPRSRERVNANVRTHGHGAHAVHGPAFRRALASTWPTTRWRSASASTANPAGERIKLAPARRDRRHAAGDRCVEDLPFAAGDNTLLFVNGMGGTPLIELYLAYNAARQSSWASGASRSPARWSATTSPRWRCRACRSPCCKLDDELTAAVGCAGAHRRAALGRLSRWRCDATDIAAAIRAVAATIAEHKVELTHLDREIGDGDHGENLDRGFTAVMAKLDADAAGHTRAAC